jgi:transposase
MPNEQVPGKPQTRRYSQEDKDAAVRMVRTLRAELGTTQGTVQRVAEQLGLRCRVGANLGQAGRD